MRRSVAIAGSTLLLLGLATGSSHVAATAPTYTVEDLGTTSDGVVPSVTGINSNGQVSGTAGTSVAQRPVRFTTGVGFEYLAGVDTSVGQGNAINANGEVAGTTVSSSGLRAFRAGTGAASFVDPEPSGTFTSGWSINGLGVVAGYGNSTAGVRGFRAAPGVPPDVLPTLGGATIAYGINDNGQVVGFSTNTANVQHAFRANPDGSLEDLGSLSTDASVATAIDANGDVVGRSVSPEGVLHAFRYTDHMIDIDTLGSSFSYALSISGAVTVGTFTAPDGSSHGFMHTFADGMIDLNTRIDANSGWVLTSATGVNSKGQIVGMGLLNDVPRAYRLTPNEPADTTPPTIRSLSVTPSIIWPPNGSMVAVAVSVTATDDVDASPVCAISSITATEPSTAESLITDATTAMVRAKKNSDGTSKIYSLTVTCSDAAGNKSTGVVTATVTHDPGLANTAVKPKKGNR